MRVLTLVMGMQRGRGPHDLAVAPVPPGHVDPNDDRLTGPVGDDNSLASLLLPRMLLAPRRQRLGGGAPPLLRLGAVPLTTLATNRGLALALRLPLCLPLLRRGGRPRWHSGSLRRARTAASLLGGQDFGSTRRGRGRRVRHSCGGRVRLVRSRGLVTRLVTGTEIRSGRTRVSWHLGCGLSLRRCVRGGLGFWWGFLSHECECLVLLRRSARVQSLASPSSAMPCHLARPWRAESAARRAHAARSRCTRAGRVPACPVSRSPSQ